MEINDADKLAARFAESSEILADMSDEERRKPITHEFAKNLVALRKKGDEEKGIVRGNLTDAEYLVVALSQGVGEQGAKEMFALFTREETDEEAS